MAEHVSRHHEVVEHLRRHTEARRQAAEAARLAALRGEPAPEEDGGDQAGG